MTFYGMANYGISYRTIQIFEFLGGTLKWQIHNWIFHVFFSNFILSKNQSATLSKKFQSFITKLYDFLNLDKFRIDPDQFLQNDKLINLKAI